MHPGEQARGTPRSHGCTPLSLDRFCVWFVGLEVSCCTLELCLGCLGRQ